MAVASFNRKAFEKIFGTLNESLQEKIALFGTPIENIANEAVEVEIFPNRPDLLSLQGYARALKAFLGKERGLKTYKISSPEKNYTITIDNAVKEVRPYTVCAVVKGLRINEEQLKEIIDLQEKLHATLGRKRKKAAIGIYPLDKITFPITFTAKEPEKIKFIPLGMREEMSGLQILQRHPAGQAYASLLAGKVVFPLFIDAAGKILSMPPIINSEETGKIETATKDVFVECSGSDAETLKKALAIVVTTLADMGGKIYATEIKDGRTKMLSPQLEPSIMKLNIENVNKMLGLQLSEKQIKDNLEKMGMEYKNKTVSIPAWRIDILHEVDCIEDIAIAYGYEKLIPQMPAVATIGSEQEMEKRKRKIAEILAGLNYLEVSNYHLTTKEHQWTAMGEKPTKQQKEITNTRTQFNLLRKDLSHYLLKNLSENIDASYPQQIFETGTIFDGLKEHEHLALAIAPGNFTQLKQALNHLAAMLRLSLQWEQTSTAPAWFIEGRVAQLIINKKIVGYCGEVHPRILKNWKIKMPVALAELNLEEIFV